MIFHHLLAIILILGSTEASRYYFSQSKLNYADASQYCQSMNAILAIPSSLDNLNFLAKLSSNNKAWLGGSISGSLWKSNNFKFSDGSSVQPAWWSQGEPNNAGHPLSSLKREENVGFWDNGLLNDYPSDTLLNFICQINIKTFGEQCVDKNDCNVDLGLECINNVCSCQTTSVWSTIKQICEKGGSDACSGHLINYWSFKDSSLKDSIGKADLYGGENYAFTTDRFGNANSALKLNTGYINIPSGTYSFGGNFTMMGWVNVQNTKYYQELFDFANGYSDAINFALSEYTNGKPYSCMYDGPVEVYTQLVNLKATTALPLNKWTHLALVFDFPQVSIYIDGELNAFQRATRYNLNTTRNNNYIGRSYSPGVSYADAIVDELKLFDIGLSQSEIQNEMNMPTCKKVAIQKTCENACSSHLVNYWSFTRTLKDSAGSADLYGGENFYYVTDRFGNANNAMGLDYGYLNIPSGKYSFGGNFTMMGWVRVQKVLMYQELFDFANGNSDAINLALTDLSSGKPYSCMYDGTNVGANQLIYNCVKATTALTLNKWTHLALVFDFPQVSLYIDGELNAFGKTSKYNPDKIRANNYIGRSYAQNVGFAYTRLDELKIFDIGLSQSEIQNEMNMVSCNVCN